MFLASFRCKDTNKRAKIQISVLFSLFDINVTVTHTTATGLTVGIKFQDADPRGGESNGLPDGVIYDVRELA
jgi:hypothetical protein